MNDLEDVVHQLLMKSKLENQMEQSKITAIQTEVCLMCSWVTVLAPSNHNGDSFFI